MEFSEAKPLISEEQNQINSEENQKNLKLNLIPNQKDSNENNNIEYDKIKLINNDDDYLGYNSKYQTSDIISEEKRTDSIEKAKSTTNSSSSQNDNNTPPRNDNKFYPNYIPYFNKCDFNSSYNRKMSSPVCLYYEGFDKYLCEKNPNLNDYTKSNNFIKKELYFGNYCEYPYDYYNEIKLRNNSFGGINELNFNNNKNNIMSVNANSNNNNNDEYNNDSINVIKNNNNKNDDNNKDEEMKINQFNLSYYNNYNYEKINSEKMRGIQSRISSNSYYPISFINNINSINSNNNIELENNISNLFGNNTNKKFCNYNKNERKKLRPFTGRSGDWVCANCQNLNFAFRVICNRCHLPKNESDKLQNTNFKKFEKYSSSNPDNLNHINNEIKEDERSINEIKQKI